MPHFVPVTGPSTGLHLRPLLAALPLALLAAPTGGLAQSFSPLEASLEAAAIEDLKRAYLRCAEAADGGSLPTGSVMHCSLVYETLKRRAFGGDFLSLLAWSRRQAVSGREDGAQAHPLADLATPE